MSYRSFWLVGAVLALGYGLTFVFAPSFLAFVYGVEYTMPIKMAYQYFGTALIGVGLLCWVARDITEPVFQKKLLIAHGVADLFGVAVSLIAAMEHTINGLAWFNIALYGTLALSCAYLHQQTPVQATSANAY